MTTKKIARSKRGTKRATEKPVDAEIARAARRAGIDPTSPIPVAPERLADLEGRAEMLNAAIEIIDEAELAFQAAGLMGADPTTVLIEALRSAKEDLRLLHAAGSGGVPMDTDMATYRAEKRIEVALLIHKFRKTYGGHALASVQARNEALLRSQLEGGAA